MNSATLKSFLGIPVLVQLNSIIIGIAVQAQQSLPYADDPKKQWVPESIMGAAGPEVTQVILYAVLREIEGSETHVEMTWACPGIANGPPATIATLLAKSDIGYVTRVVAVPETGRILLG